MNQIVFNSFPRSGNVYSGHCLGSFIEGMFATVHIPEIFQVKEIDNVTIFRKPEDAIASLMNKQLETSPDPSSGIPDEVMKDVVMGPIQLYRKYMDYATKYYDNIYIGRFEDLIGDTVQHFENVAKRFNQPLLDNYKERFAQKTFQGPMWQDRHDGHVPREKDELRLALEKSVAAVPAIQELNLEYADFIAKYATQVN